LKYSAYNLALPTEQAASAQQDYDKMLAAAKVSAASGEGTGVSDYISFVNTYLDKSKEALKSSQAYQDRYATVMADIASLDTHGTGTVSTTAELTAAIEVRRTAELENMGWDYNNGYDCLWDKNHWLNDIYL